MPLRIVREQVSDRWSDRHMKEKPNDSRIQVVELKLSRYMGPILDTNATPALTHGQAVPIH